mmetsp:Transcript_28415/g.29591  ORF Transcript_28415/g.29591 Transcript_28415/m.29591 type:complete len:86 (+) Transcript_28415:16-273(+)
MRSFYRIARKRFSGNQYHYHHDFNPEYLAPNNWENTLLYGSDYIRFLFYFGSLFLITYNTPLLIMFQRRNKHIDNPDYMLDSKQN